MTVTVRLLGLHRALLPPAAVRDGYVRLQFDGAGVTVATVMAELGMTADAGRIVLLDGEAIGDDHVLRDGQTVTFVSPLGGG